MNAERRVLAPDLYLAPTPTGALRAVTVNERTAADDLIRHLLASGEPVTTAQADLWQRIGLAGPVELVEVVGEAQRHGWIEGRTRPAATLAGPLGVELPALLAPLAQDGRAALVDDQGFTLATVGFSADAAAELSVFAAEVSRIQQRRSIDAALPSSVEGWGLIDSRGVPSISICPIQVGAQPFVLILGGFPRLRQEPFVTLIAALSRRYAEAGVSDAPAGAESQDPPREKESHHA